MTEKPDNPSAFPKAADTYLPGSRGMTLRDYFAGQWLTTFRLAPGSTLTVSDIAGQCYDLADAMLSERSRP